MATAETLNAWRAALDECDELYRQVADTVSDLPEPSTDLAGTTSKGAPPPLPGGDKLAAIGPFDMYAARDDFPHPLLFAYTWAWHCAEVDRGIPPRRAWKPSLAYLRANLHRIDHEHESSFHGDLRRTQGILRRLCNIGRPSQAEEIEKRLLRAYDAQQELQARADEVPPDYMLTKDEVTLIWPELREPIEGEYSESDPYEIEKAWWRIRRRKTRRAREGYEYPMGEYPAEWCRTEARRVKPWQRDVA